MQRTVGVAVLDISIARLCRGRDDSERHQPAQLRCGESRAYGFLEGGDVPDHVIGRQHQQYRICRVGVVRAGRKCGVRRKRNGGSRVAAEGLEHRRTRLDIELAQLLGHEKPMGIVADDDRRRGAEAIQTQRGLLEHRALADQGEELLGIKLARQRPQTCARTA